MRGLILLAFTFSLTHSAPQFLSEQNKGENCRTEVTTVFEETEAESINRVICETEFRDNCVTKVDNVCRNISTGEQSCELVDTFRCEDSMTNKCGVEQVLKNVSYTETICKTVMEDICEMELREGLSQPVEGSCVSKPVEDCGPETRFEEEFVEEEVCRDIPIKDCKNVQEEVCTEVKEKVCEEVEMQECDIIPHEECKQVVEKVPKKISKKVTKVVCDNAEEEKMNMTAEYDEYETAEDEVPDINDILEIFGVNVNDNEVGVDDGLLSESTTAKISTQSTSTTTTTVATTTTTTTTTSSTSTTPSTTAEPSTTTESEEFSTRFPPRESEFVTTEGGRTMDGSKIIFSDDAINSRNKDLANRVYVGQVPSTTTTRTTQRVNNPNSKIFFPE